PASSSYPNRRLGSRCDADWDGRLLRIAQSGAPQQNLSTSAKGPAGRYAPARGEPGRPRLWGPCCVLAQIGDVGGRGWPLFYSLCSGCNAWETSSVYTHGPFGGIYEEAEI